MKIRSTVTITQVTEVPFNEENYPEAETLTDAVEYENDLDEVDVVTNFVESLEYKSGFRTHVRVEAINDDGSPVGYWRERDYATARDESNGDYDKRSFS